MKINKQLILLFAILLSCSQSQAQTTDTDIPWYVGVKGGIPFGASNFKSFGADKTRIGYNVGLLTGYRYNSILSAELSATFGSMGLGASSCCADYWLGADGVRHLSADLNKKGHFYKDLYSSVALQQYGLHINVDLLPLFNRNTKSRFNIMLSPAIYGVGTQATIKTTTNDEEFINADKQFNLGIGADLSVGYRINNNIDLRISSGINNVSGDSYDGIPSEHHKANFIVNNNISVVWRFGKKRETVASPATTTPLPQVESHEEKQKRIEIERQREIQQQEQIETEKLKQVQLEIQIKKRKEIERQTKVAESITFPKLYFAFNVSANSQTEFEASIMETIRLLNQNPLIDITIKGYADKRGTAEANQNVSLDRANTVKNLLIENGIAPERIATIGMGVDKTAKTQKEARRADIHLNVKQ